MKKSFLPLLLLLLTACGQPSSVVESPDWPDIFPDYCGVTIPDDLAGLTFAPIGAEHFRIEKAREADTLWYTVTAWSKGKKSGTRYRPFPVYLSHDAIDPCIAYRLIEPGYESWYDSGSYPRTRNRPSSPTAPTTVAASTATPSRAATPTTCSSMPVVPVVAQCSLAVTLTASST